MPTPDRKQADGNDAQDHERAAAHSHGEYARASRRGRPAAAPADRASGARLRRVLARRRDAEMTTAKDRCWNCGGDAGDNWFDRSICPSPCDSMHTRCVKCGVALDHCPFDGSVLAPDGSAEKPVAATKQERVVDAAREWIRVYDAQSKSAAEWSFAMQRLRIALYEYDKAVGK